MPQPIKVGLPPELGYLKESISACANQNQTFDIVLLEKNSYEWNTEPIDVVFSLQQAAYDAEYTFLIDEVDVQVIASSDFPLSSMDVNQLQRVFNVDMVNPEFIGLSANTPITLWGFESDSEMAALFEKQYGFSPQLPEDAFLSASPQSAVEKISSASTSIGYTISSAVTGDVKVLHITDTNPTELIPVIAAFHHELTMPQEEFIRCMQTQLID